MLVVTSLLIESPIFICYNFYKWYNNGGLKMTLKLYCYPNCSTCKKAKKWLEDSGKTFEAIHIVENSPSREELLDLIEKSGLPAKRFFNTSGKKYRELNLKDKIKDASVGEMAEIL